jgi:hypothetical protein
LRICADYSTLNTEKAELNNGAIARHLSKNQSKHLFAETSGEKLVAMLQIVLDAGGGTKKDEAILKIQDNARSITGGSKYSGFLGNNDTIDLYLRFMSLTEEYRGMDAVSLKWGLDHFRADYGGVSSLPDYMVIIANNSIVVSDDFYDGTQLS